MSNTLNLTAKCGVNPHCIFSHLKPRNLKNALEPRYGLFYEKTGYPKPPIR